jgi:hypothetical protein
VLTPLLPHRQRTHGSHGALPRTLSEPDGPDAGVIRRCEASSNA